MGLAICAVLFAHSRLRATLGSRRQPSMYATTPPQRGRAPFVPARVLCIKTYGLGNIAMILPTLGALHRGFPGVKDWIMDVPNLAGKRAILMGAALGAISTGLRVILGLERAHLGGG